LPMKMEPIEGYETSAIRTKTPENYPKENILHYKNRLFIIQTNKCTTNILILIYISQALLHVSVHLHRLQGDLTLCLLKHTGNTNIGFAPTRLSELYMQPPS